MVDVTIRQKFPQSLKSEPFKRQPHKLVKHNQAIRRQQPTNCLSVFDNFVRLALKGLKYILTYYF